MLGPDWAPAMHSCQARVQGFRVLGTEAFGLQGYRRCFLGKLQKSCRTSESQTPLSTYFYAGPMLVRCVRTKHEVQTCPNVKRAPSDHIVLNFSVKNSTLMVSLGGLGFWALRSLG